MNIDQLDEGRFMWWKFFNEMSIHHCDENLSLWGRFITSIKIIDLMEIYPCVENGWLESKQPMAEQGPTQSLSSKLNLIWVTIRASAQQKIFGPKNLRFKKFFLVQNVVEKFLVQRNFGVRKFFWDLINVGVNKNFGS